MCEPSSNNNGSGGSVDSDIPNLKKDIEKLKNCVTYSLAMNETTDITDTSQLAIFIRGVDKNLIVVEEVLALMPLTDTYHYQRRSVP